jgi:glycosyltransferase involved in cell wall biosynthesis
VILDALGKCDPAVLMAFLGAGYESRWSAEAAARGVERRVAFLAAVSPWEVVPTIASADAAAVLYRPLDDNVRNCLPNGCFQALAAGLPIIYAEDLPMVAAMVGDAGIPVDADDPASVADAIGRLSSDTGLRDRLATAARARAEHVTWKQYETRLAQLVVEAIGLPPADRSSAGGPAGDQAEAITSS